MSEWPAAQKTVRLRDALQIDERGEMKRCFGRKKNFEKCQAAAATVHRNSLLKTRVAQAFRKPKRRMAGLQKSCDYLHEGNIPNKAEERLGENSAIDFKRCKMLPSFGAKERQASQIPQLKGAG